MYCSGVLGGMAETVMQISLDRVSALVLHDVDFNGWPILLVTSCLCVVFNDRGQHVLAGMGGLAHAIDLLQLLILYNMQVYPGYRDFMHALAVRGGVVEAVPAALLGSPTANLLVDPTGRVALLSSHEKILVAPFW
jgi:hypothetical protein